MKDIEQRKDIENLVDKFYGKIMQDELMKPVFEHVNLPHHLPVMYDFWSSMLLGDQTYKGNPLQKHLPLAIKRQHFSRWLDLFQATVDDNFKGEKAEEIKMRAVSIAGIFQLKMGLINDGQI